jgi:hypothetical protein
MAGTTEQGRTWRWSFGDGADPETFATLGGEKNWDFNPESNDVDTSDKDGPSGVFVPGRIKCTISGNVKLPDAGFSAVMAAAKSGDYINAKLQKGTIAKFASLVSVGNPKISGPTDGTVTFSFDLSNAAVADVYAIDAVN